MADKFQTAREVAQGIGSGGPVSTAGPREAQGDADSATVSAGPQLPLPSSWEEFTSDDGWTYCVNHDTRTTAWRGPEVETGGDGANAQAGLPAAWQALVDDQGRTYYANHESRTTTFERPKGSAGELPAGWELLRTPEGVAYFANHNTHIATWEDPRSA